MPDSTGDATGTEALDLDAMRARAEAADAGPWRVDEEGWIDEIPTALNILGGGPPGSMAEHAVAWTADYGQGVGQCEADAEFIAHAREDVPALIAEVERLRGLLALGGVPEGPGHALRFTLEDWGAVGVTVDCSYDLTSPDRPCAIYNDYEERDPPEKLMVGVCGVKHWLDEAGVEALQGGDDVVSPPTRVDVAWQDGGYEVTLAAPASLGGDADARTPRKGVSDDDTIGAASPGEDECPSVDPGGSPATDDAGPDVSEPTPASMGDGAGTGPISAPAPAGDTVTLPTWVAQQISDYLHDECRFDHHGYCQAHMLTTPCPVPVLLAALPGPHPEGT